MLDFAIRYLHVLKTKLAGLNLTTILDQDEFYHKQILDSINPYLQSETFQKEVQKRGIVVDVGFGGGFPILPLAKLLPEVTFVGVESRRKKADAVRLIASELGLANVVLVHSRLEDFEFDVPAVVTFKAVGTIENYLPIINHPHKDLAVFFYKGPSFQELEGKSIEKLSRNWKFVGQQEIEVPGTEKRVLVGFVPRGTQLNSSKNLVKLSEFL
jgi:16S rRNA (guanine527-N7)-methyltransferase